jgi:hypothetical protein
VRSAQYFLVGDIRLILTRRPPHVKSISFGTGRLGRAVPGTAQKSLEQNIGNILAQNIGTVGQERELREVKIANVLLVPGAGVEPA